MRILIVHNHYQSAAPSGEDAVFMNEVEVLRRNGLSVFTYEKHNDDTVASNRMNIARDIVWSETAYNEVRKIIRSTKPDICHFHNLFYLISPAAYYACNDARVPAIQSLHNFRFFCANGLLLRDGHICEDCIGCSSWRSIFHGCYRNSQLYSIPLALMQSYHKYIKTWDIAVDAYIALTDFSRRKFLQCGLPAKKMFVKPNFVPDLTQQRYAGNGYSVFIGRLSEEKGVHTLLDAMSVLASDNSGNVSLKIIGDGVRRDELVEKSRNLGIKRNVDFVGYQAHDACMKSLARARFLMLPSLCYEGFPLTIIEAYAYGKPVIASNLGALAELVEDGKTGLLFEPGNAQDLASKIRWMLEHEDECIQMGRNARMVFEEKYTAEKNFKILMNIYETVLARHRSASRKRRYRPIIFSRNRQCASRDTLPGVTTSYKSLMVSSDEARGDGKVILQGVKFLPVHIDAAVKKVLECTIRNDGGYFCLANIHVVMESHRDSELKQVLNNAAGVFADGMGTAGALKYLSHMFKGRVRGADLMLRLCDYGAKNNLRIFLYGNTDSRLGKLGEMLHTKYPGMNIVGMHAPPFRELTQAEDDCVVRMINRADPDILFVSLGAPKQEKWMAAHKGRIRAIQLGVGAAFDYIAGDLKQAPAWMQNHYLEWLYRLPQQPKKTISRMLLLPEFLIRLFIQRFWR